MNRYLKLLHPVEFIRLLIVHRYAHFFAVGATGVFINLSITAFFAELVFGREHYFSAYLVGLGANLIYNFVLHTAVTFKTKTNHARRLAIFVAYSLALTYLQAYLVKTITPIVGIDFYLLVIASVILVFSVATFVLFKFVLFREGDRQMLPEEGLVANPPSTR